jgi:predicted ABC-type ATPase
VTDKQLWVLAGGNGAGKSTFYRLRLEHLGLPFVNADILAKDLYPDSPEQHCYDAAKFAGEIRHDLLIKGQTFCFETVFSHPSKIDFVGQAKALGYQIILVFIHLDSVELNQARITQRVFEGGHNVPEDKVKNRIPRTLKHIRTAIPLCDIIYLLDNSRIDNPFHPLAIIRNNNIELYKKPPEWVNFLIS